LVDVTIALEVGGWGTEFACIGRVGCKGFRQDRATREEPGLDGVAVPFHDIVSAFVVVEAFAEGVGADFIDITTGRAVGIDSAVGEDLGVALIEAVDFALSVGVQDVLINLVVIDTFDDVDLQGISILLWWVVILLGRTSPFTGHGS
jgi:hypothetical protein